MQPQDQPEAAAPLNGHLWVFVAFDWGEEVDLDQARHLAGGAALELSRRPRTPSSFAYKPPPLRFPLGPLTLPLPGLEQVPALSAEATVFDFAAVSVGVQVPFSLGATELTALAGRLADPAESDALVRAARSALKPLYQKLLPAIQKPWWQDAFWEEYFVFQFPPGPAMPTEYLLAERAPWLAGLVRLEDAPLSAEEIAEAVRLYLRYGHHDLFVADWAAAVLVDQEHECGETLQAVEFANLQLLQYRNIDGRLDQDQARAQKMIHASLEARVPLWRSTEAPVRVVGELKVEASALFERTLNVLKLVGDQYLARLYRLLATRFHLREWERSISRKLEVIEGVYQVLSDQGVAFRTELLEIIVVVLIVIEVLLAVFQHH
jgi:hypothetical protein